MSEPSFGDYIALNHAMIVSLVLSLIAAGTLAPSEIAAELRESAEDMENDRTRAHLLALAEKLERAEAEAARLLAEAPDQDVPAGEPGPASDI